MTASNESTVVNSAGIGPAIATFSVGSKAHQVVMVAGIDGNIIDSNAVYTLLIGSTAVGSSKTQFDLFVGSGSPVSLRVTGMYAVPQLQTVTAASLAAEFNIIRTSSIGAGGTAATSLGTPFGAAQFVRRDPNDTLVSSFVTARTQTNSITDGEWISNVMATAVTSGPFVTGFGTQHNNMIKEDLIVRPNTGLKVKQGTISSAGAYTFKVIFEQF